jgi:pyruvate/2-oxoglutarate/acetoin dehydrogenase E1 component
MARKRYIQAINDALFEEMERDPKIILFGEDVEISMFGDTQGLHARFGANRIRNTPICEATLTGMAVGAAASGYRVVLHMMFSNFIYTGFDAIANQISKLRLMTGGQMRLPITILAGYGGGRSAAAQHSDTPYPALMNLGGVNVIVPASPADAKGLLKTVLRADNPSFFLEAGGRGGEMAEVPEGDYAIPLGKAATLREGRDVTIVAIGTMVKHALAAAGDLQSKGIDAELIDVRTLVPLDEDTILASVRKTGRLIVADESRDRCSAASHIAAIAAEKAFASLRAPPMRVTVPNVAIPYAPGAEKNVLPNAAKIVAAALAVVGAGALQ